MRLVTLCCLLSLTLPGCKKHTDETSSSETPANSSETVNAGTTASQNPTSATAAATAAELATTDVAYETWFKKYGLDLNDAKMLDSDADGDGYTNREEFLADTNPLDPDSRPGIHPSMRLKEFTEIRVPYMLKSVDGESAKIEHTDGGEAKTETVKAGQSLRGSPYKVQKVESLQTQDKDGNPVDASKVTLEDPASQKVDLVINMPTRSSDSFASLVSKDGSTSINVKQGQVFEWPGEKNTHYRVVDLRNDSIILEQIENKKMWTVPKK